jgi:predicted RNA-binding protein with PUA-like domain
MAPTRKYWLMKSEPDVFSIDDLKACKVTCWDGVRNYQARNTMRDEMRVGDGVLFYHSNADPSGIAGLAEVVREGYPDDTAFDPKDPHYDPRSDAQNPTWYRVDVKYVRTAGQIIPLSRLRKIPGLKKMILLRHGRLSVQPVTPGEWKIILGLPEWKRSAIR